MTSMTNVQFQELMKVNLKKYFKKDKFSNTPENIIYKFTTVDPSINKFDIIEEYNKTLTKKDNNDYILSIEKEQNEELQIIKKEKKEIKTEMKKGNKQSK